MTRIQYLDDKIPGQFGRGWWRTVRVLGVRYRVGLWTDGRPVKIAYRGGQRGFRYWGQVMCDGKSIFCERVPATLGARGILKRAEII